MNQPAGIDDASKIDSSHHYAHWHRPEYVSSRDLALGLESGQANACQGLCADMRDEQLYKRYSTAKVARARPHSQRSGRPTLPPTHPDRAGSWATPVTRANIFPRYPLHPDRRIRSRSTHAKGSADPFQGCNGG